MSNFTPSTATVIVALPYDVSVDVSAAPTGTGYASTCFGGQFHATWYRYTTGANERTIAVLGQSVGADTFITSVWTGTLPGITQYNIDTQDFCGNQTGGFWFEVPVAASTTYWFQFEMSVSTPPSANLRVRLERAPQTAVPSGSLCIPDDADGFPASVLSASATTILRIVPFPEGELAATLPGGIYCVQNGPTLNSVTILDLNFGTTAVISVPNFLRAIASNNVDKFYIAHAVNTITALTLRRFSNSGALETSWTLPSDSAAVEFIAVNQAGTILYYANGNIDEPIHRYDLTGSAPLSDLVAGVAAERVKGRSDGYVDSSGNVYVGYSSNNSGANGKIRKYDSTGTLQWTTALTAGNFGLLNHFAVALPADSLWAWGFPSVGTTPFTMRKVRFSDGAITVTNTNFPAMLTSGEPDAANAPFGVSNSCPLFVLSAAMTMPTVSGVTVDCTAKTLTVAGTHLDLYSSIVVTDNSTPVSFTVSSVSATELVLTLDAVTNAHNYCVTVNDLTPSCHVATCSTFTIAANCAANTITITGTNLDTYTTITLTGPDGSAVSFTVTSVTPTHIVITPNVAMSAGQYCVTVDGSEPGCAVAMCGGTNFPLRRIRRFDPMFDRNLTTFVRRIEILIQSGMSANQTLFLRVSKDGGQTFGAFQAMAAGALSAFTTRLFLTNLGSGRNWVFEVMADSADPWFLIEATVDMELGTS